MNKIIVNQIASQNLNTETYIQTPIGKLRFYSTTSDGSVEEINILQCDVGQLLPERMRVPTTMEENEIRICLKELPVGKSYSLPYVISWNDFPEPEGSFCWLNVDLPHKLVRKLLTKLLVDNSSL